MAEPVTLCKDGRHGHYKWTVDPDCVLTIDPGRQFGSVCIFGTRIPASSIAGCVMAGDSVTTTADGYDVTREQVMLACWWAYRYDLGNTKFDRTIRREWADWADRAQRHFGRYTGENAVKKLEDPPIVEA